MRDLIYIPSKASVVLVTTRDSYDSFKFLVGDVARQQKAGVFPGHPEDGLHEQAIIILGG